MTLHSYTEPTELTLEQKQERIDKFLKLLGEVKKNDEAPDGFWIVCKKCGSNNVIKYNDVGMGSEYTGMYGDAGLKCIDCGNAAEIFS